MRDLHLETAVDLFGVKPDEVTPEMRQKAKVINYLRAYGDVQPPLPPCFVRPDDPCDDWSAFAGLNPKGTKR
jgi:hypothetical protein